MTQPDITPERVLELIEAFGGESGGWPEDEREAAIERIASDPDAYEEALQAARALDSVLLREDVPEPSFGLGGEDPRGSAHRKALEAPELDKRFGRNDLSSRCSLAGWRSTCESFYGLSWRICLCLYRYRN